MQLPTYTDTPFQIQFSFFELIENLEKVAADPSHKSYADAKQLLAEVALHPELKEGITEIEQIEQNADLIGRLVAEMFPESLSQNEIKAISLPYQNLFFNHTERFKSILKAAGPGFEINIRDFDEHQLYVLSCCIILNEFYGTQLDFRKPLFFDIPTAQGIKRHYRILYNADYMHIQPTDKALTITQADIDLLLNNYDNLDLWKQMFPKESWILKGFTIINLFDVTVENAVSLLKENLLLSNVQNFRQSLENIFRSIYLIPDIKIGFMFFDQQEGIFDVATLAEPIKSFILNPKQTSANNALCVDFYRNMVNEQTYFAISDVEELTETQPQSALANHLLKQGIGSIVLAPVVKNNTLLGVLEVVSSRPKELHSVNAHKLEMVMPFLTDTIERLLADFQNQVQSIIQSNYTTIHPSVNWRFKEEAQQLLRARREGKSYELKEIVFKQVYPLYGQVDIKGSSDARNASIQKDLQCQLTALLGILEQLKALSPTFAFEQERQQVAAFAHQLQTSVFADTEQQITDYLGSVLHYQLYQITDPAAIVVLKDYFTETNKQTGRFYAYRRKYETSVALINDKLAQYLDSSQVKAQTIFPHYYERFRTDGIEHNLYIGSTIAPDRKFDMQYLHELRLWQLRTVCEMEKAHHQLKPALPYPFEVTTLILTYHSPLSIRFRMDEKRFDVDGTYNARFEIIKKRIDKAHIKDSDERITQPGKLTIVCSSHTEEQDYMHYLSLLQQEQLVDAEIEQLDIEDLQGVAGLRALRVKILHNS